MMTVTAEKPEKVKIAFSPNAPDSLEALDIPESLVEDLMLRRLYIKGSTSMTALCSSLKLSYPVIHDLFQRHVEDLLLGREVVVEGPEAHVGRVGDPLDADLGRIPGAQQSPSSRDQRGPREGLSPVETIVGRPIGHVEARRRTGSAGGAGASPLC